TRPSCALSPPPLPMAASAIARTSQMAWRMRRPPLSACWKGAILARRWCELRRQPDIVRFVTAAAIARYDSQVIVRRHGAAPGPLRRLCHGLSAFEGHLRERPPGVDRLRGRLQRGLGVPRLEERHGAVVKLLAGGASPRFGAAISVNRTAPCLLTFSVSKTICESPAFDGCLGPPRRSQVYGKETDGAAPRFAQDFTSDASPFPNDQSSRPVPTRLKKTSSRRTPRRSWRSSTTRL